MFRIEDYPDFLDWLDAMVTVTVAGNKTPLTFAFNHLMSGIPLEKQDEALCYVVIETFNIEMSAHNALEYLQFKFEPTLTHKEWTEMLLYVPIQALVPMMKLSGGIRN